MQMELGELISFYRKQLGMTIEELSEKSGVAKGTLTKIIGGVTKAPTLDNMKAIARALGKRLEDFDDPQPQKARGLSPAEERLLRQYRALDAYGQETVDWVLSRESGRVRALKAAGAPGAEEAAEPLAQLAAFGGGSFAQQWNDQDQKDFEEALQQSLKNREKRRNNQ